MKELDWSINKTNQGGGDDSDSNDSDRVLTSNNRIYFYSEVSRTKVLTLNKSIINVGLSLQNRANSLGSESPSNIHLYIFLFVLLASNYLVFLLVYPQTYYN